MATPMTTVTERALIAALVLLPACRDGPTVPAGAVRFDPPARFRALWTETEQCAGRRRPFDAVRWYQVPDVWEVTTNGRRVAGFYNIAGDYVVIAGAYMTSDPLVRHEALHAILDEPGHPAEFDLCDLRLAD
jgi:hypothetical protein